LKFIAKDYKDHRIRIAAPGYWNNSLIAWNCLVALPGEFLGQVREGKNGTVLIEERDVPGGVGPRFAEVAKEQNWKNVFHNGTLVLWEAETDPGDRYPAVGETFDW
jgi:hypothetical protein